MTLTASTVRLQYNGDGTTASFDVTFDIWDEDDIEVIHTDSSGVETTWVRGTQYTVSLTSPPNTATLSVVTSPTDYTPASEETLTILGSLANTQSTDLPTGGSLPSASVEQMVDKAVRQIQQLAEEVDRCVKFVKSSTQVDIPLPEPEAGKIMRWNSAADEIENVDAGTSLTTPLSVADGGTGGTSVATALSNLGVRKAAQRVSLWKLGQF